jgi:1-deoxy-D-xylulose-5-phosphate reductoisomerase
MATVTILGSTGSIGLSALRVMRALGGEFDVYGLACRSSVAALDAQIREFRPSVVAVASPAPGGIEALRSAHPRVEFLCGDEGVIELCGRDVDVLVSAIVGAAGLRPAVTAIPHIKRLALANKETLVMAGDIVMEMARDYGVELVPVDSEHSALFMLLEGRRKEDVSRLILTASGGSLRDRAADELPFITPGEALAHPTWDMGSKITIDSATLMNKGFEVIEAHHLFGIDYGRIDVVIHPESIIHSMVETVDGAIYAHMSVTDMALPILNALVYPLKREHPFGRLDLAAAGRLSFQPYDPVRFPGLDLCRAAGRAGGTVPAVLNAANEIAVEAFLGGSIRFTDIVRVVERALSAHERVAQPGLDEVFDADRRARDDARRFVSSLA